ncbi:hypothetical protein BC940DRAFT_304820 [Gongronella butleri]|nr:hypothetical protein BC940DRAFT_304820 [Gongronella butleri]
MDYGLIALPSSILQRVISLLDWPDQCELRRVSMAWHHRVTANSFAHLKIVRTNQIDSLLAVPRNTMAVWWLPYIKSLDLKSAQVPLDRYQRLIELCPALENLTLYYTHFGRVPRASITHGAQLAPSLTTLTRTTTSSNSDDSYDQRMDADLDDDDEERHSHRHSRRRRHQLAPPHALDFFRAICARTPHLQNVQLKESSRASVDPVAYHVFLHAMLPFLPPTISSLDIYVYSPNRFQVLQLHHLEAIIQQCPQLETLSCALMLSSPYSLVEEPDTFLIPSASSPCTTLKSLTIMCGTTEAFAYHVGWYDLFSYLSLKFPSLQHLFFIDQCHELRHVIMTPTSSALAPLTRDLPHRFPSLATLQLSTRFVGHCVGAALFDTPADRLTFLEIDEGATNLSGHALSAQCQQLLGQLRSLRILKLKMGMDTLPSVLDAFDPETNRITNLRITGRNLSESPVTAPLSSMSITCITSPTSPSSVSSVPTSTSTFLSICVGLILIRFRHLESLKLTDARLSATTAMGFMAQPKPHPLKRISLNAVTLTTHARLLNFLSVHCPNLQSWKFRAIYIDRGADSIVYPDLHLPTPMRRYLELHRNALQLPMPATHFTKLTLRNCRFLLSKMCIFVFSADVPARVLLVSSQPHPPSQQLPPNEAQWLVSLFMTPGNLNDVNNTVISGMSDAAQACLALCRTSRIAVLHCQSYQRLEIHGILVN